MYRCRIRKPPPVPAGVSKGIPGRPYPDREVGRKIIRLDFPEEKLPGQCPGRIYRALRSARWQSNSYISVAPASEVRFDESNGGETSTRSAPT